MSAELSNLPWLPDAPSDFRDQCRTIEESAGPLGPALRALAQHALSDSHLTTMARTVTRLRSQNGGKIAGLTPFKVGIISNATTALLAPAMTASALRYGVDLTVIEAEFNQVMQTAAGSGLQVIDARPNAMLLALDHNGYADLRSGLNGSAQGAVAYFKALRDGLRHNFEGALICQTVACPPEQLFGSFDVTSEVSQRARVDLFNREMINLVRGSSDVLLDAAGLAQSIGSRNWFDSVQWHMAKLPFAQKYVPIYAEHCARLIGAMLGRSRKCLVLDLDNTVWGGVIGDDGMNGIVLGHGSAQGEAFLAIQQMALDLRDRGILLAVSSKNDDGVARAVFREHPEMLLREEHITVFQANWSDKASNLEAIAQTLNIGMDALVFVDDNPAERQQVRQAVPLVAVPELGDDPAFYPRQVMAAGYFEAIAFLEDDRQRVAQYQANAKRAALQTTARDLTAYLHSLEMVATVGPFDAAGRSRITQLINKSNQFNLTVQRYTEAEVERVSEDPDALTLQIRLADSFGDNGMISVLIARNGASGWTIETWLMSCRVLGRGVERAALNEIVTAVAKAGGSRLIGRYHPTNRNQMVELHYKRLGFELVETHADGTTTWMLDVAGYRAPDVPIKILRMT